MVGVGKVEKEGGGGDGWMIGGRGWGEGTFEGRAIRKGEAGTEGEVVERQHEEDMKRR